MPVVLIPRVFNNPVDRKTAGFDMCQYTDVPGDCCRKAGKPVATGPSQLTYCLLPPLQYGHTGYVFSGSEDCCRVTGQYPGLIYMCIAL